MKASALVATAERPSGAQAASSPSEVTPVLGAGSARRGLQVALGLLWLLDAALQFQPYMFTNAFVNQTLASTAAGNPGIISTPITWVAGLIVHHPVFYNSLFASFQLLLALGLFWRRTVKVSVVASIVWATAVWWFGEGLGGVLTGATNPFMGAPGAVILYAFVAILVWPTDKRSASAAASSPLGYVASGCLWLTLWSSFIWWSLQPANRSASSLGAMVGGMAAGEPGWIKALDHTLNGAVSGRGTEVSMGFSILCAVAGVSVFVPFARRLGIGVAVALAVAIWIAEDFGAILTGTGTDPNSGLVLMLLAAAFWPTSRRTVASSRDVLSSGRTFGVEQQDVLLVSAGERLDAGNSSIG